MVDYLSKSSSKISGKSDEKHDNLNNSASTSIIMTSSLKRKDQVLYPKDIASNTLTSTVEYVHHQRSSSNQVGQNFQHRSTIHQHLSLNPPFNRQRITDVDAFISVRKTRSMTFPTITNVPWYRNGTASTPDLTIDQYKTEYASISPQKNIRCRSMHGVCTLTYNMHFIEITLDCIILVAGFIHLALAMALTINKDIILTVVKQKIYTLIKTTFIIVSLVLLIFSTIAFCCLHKGQKRRAMHVACSLMAAIIMLFFASMQNKVEDNILTNIEESMISMINFETIYFPSSTWDKFHKTFKCCGAKGNLDWCLKEKFHGGIDLKIDKLNSVNFVGFYICRIPKSCCASINEYNVSTVPSSQESCLLYPTPWNTYRPGCVTPLKLEVFYMSKLYKVLCFTTIAVLLLSMITSIFLCTSP